MYRRPFAGRPGCVMLPGMPGPDATVIDYFADAAEFTEAQRILFLHRLVNNGGDIKDALDDVSVSPVVALRAYNASPQFKAAWDEAMNAATVLIEHTALRRASYTKRKVLDQSGVEVEIEDKPADRMVQMMLKARKPDVYSDKLQVTGKDGGPLQVRDALIEQILALVAGTKDAKEPADG